MTPALALTSALALALAVAGCAGSVVSSPEVGSVPVGSTAGSTVPPLAGSGAASEVDAGRTAAARGEAGAFDPLALLAPRPPGPAVPFGLALAAEELVAVEAAAGRAVGVVRVFARWDTPFPTAEQQALLDGGRVLHLSVRPRTEDGTDIAWADLATAQPGSALHDQLDTWTRTVAGYGRQVYFTLNHEPETAASAGHGTPADYRAAWRRTVELLRANGGAEVRTVVVLGRGAYADGSVEAWYPGDDVVDVVGVDAYNWFDCQGGPVRPWIMPADLLTPAVTFAARHDKPLAVPEIASTERANDPLAKGVWIVELARALTAPELAGRIEFAAWFSAHDPAWPRCRWGHDSSPASGQALAAAIAWLNHPA